MRSLLLLSLLALVACDSDGTTNTEVVRYAGPAITEAGAAVTDETGQTRRWKARVFDGHAEATVSISRSVTCGDECSRTLTLYFRDRGQGRLPEFVSGTVETVDFFPERREVRSLDVGRVEIQDWQPDLYSGRAIPREGVVDVAALVFWADDVTTAVE